MVRFVSVVVEGNGQSERRIDLTRLVDVVTFVIRLVVFRSYSCMNHKLVVCSMVVNRLSFFVETSYRRLSTFKCNG